MCRCRSPRLALLSLPIPAISSSSPDPAMSVSSPALPVIVSLASLFASPTRFAEPVSTNASRPAIRVSLKDDSSVS